MEAVTSRNSFPMTTMLNYVEEGVSNKRCSLSASEKFLDVPGSNLSTDSTPAGSAIGSRRASTRVLSLNVQQTLRHLRQEEHKRRVEARIEKNAESYEKQRFCECITMLSLLSIFTSFSLYVVFAHGFHFGKENPFNVREGITKFTKHENESVDLICKADSYWEWCRWIHLDSYCDFEWVSRRSGVQKVGCDIPSSKIELIGDYDKHECGIRVHDLGVKDRGQWQCELEKYYVGFSRRYGEFASSKITLFVIKELEVTTKAFVTVNSPMSSSFPSTTSKSELYDVVDLLQRETNYTGNGSMETDSEDEEKGEKMNSRKEYDRDFFLLRIFVLGGVGFVLFILIAIFWAYFMYLWRTIDGSVKRDHSEMRPEFIYQPQDSGIDLESSNQIKAGTAFLEQQSLKTLSLPERGDLIVNETLRQSRRKSVSFAVCKLDHQTNVYNIERKSVMIDDPNLPPLISSTFSTGPRKPNIRGQKDKSFLDVARLVQVARRLKTKTLANVSTVTSSAISDLKAKVDRPQSGVQTTQASPSVADPSQATEIE